MKLKRSIFVSSFAILFSMAHVAKGGVLEWSGSTTGLVGGSNNTWDSNTTANWWNGASNVVWPAAGGSDDDASFAGVGGSVTIGTGGVTANDLSFLSSGYTIAGAALTLNGSNPSLAAASGVSATISSVIGGASGLTKLGAGTLTLSGTNTYTGLTSISAGTLIAGSNAALGASAGGAADGTSVAAGATLDVGGRNFGAEIVTVSGTGVGGNGAIINSGAAQIQAFRFITLGGNTTVGGPNRWDIRSNTTATLDMGGFTLTKTNPYYMGVVGTSFANPGNIIINQGEINISTSTNMAGTSANSVTVNNGGTLGMYQSSVAPLWTLNLNDGATFRGENGTTAQNNWAGPVNLSGTVTLRAESTHALNVNGVVGSNGNLNKTGAGTVVLRGANSFVGTTTLSEGTLTLDYAIEDNSKLHDASALFLRGGTLSLVGGSHTEEVASTTLGTNTANTVSLVSGLAVANLNAITVETGATLNFSGNAIATTDTPNTNGILGPWATVGGTQWAVNSTNGSDGLINALTDFVSSSVLANDAALYQNQHIVVDSSQTPSAGIQPLSLIFNAAAANTLTLQGVNTIATGGVLVGTTVANNLSSITGGSITGPSNGAVTLNQRNTSNVLNVASSIVDNGVTSLTKSGAGNVVLSGNNSYSGTTHIASGSLQINSASSLGGGMVTTSGTNNAALVLGDGVVVPSSKSISIAGSGAEQFYGALSTAGGNTTTSEWQGPVTIAAVTGTRIGTLGGTLHISGNIGESASGSQLIVRNNETANGTTILSGNNTFSGGLYLAAGNLRMGSANALGNGVMILGNGNSVNAFSSDSTAPRTIANPVEFNSTTTHNLGSATLNGKLTFSGGASLGGAARTLGVASTVEFSSPISSTGNFGIIKTGTGDLILSAANTYAGTTQINGGTLVVSHKDALAFSSSVFPSTATGSGTLRLATDTSAVINRIESSSSNPGTVLSDRATPGDGINHVVSAGWFGANTYTFAAGPNVTGGIARITFNSVNLTAGTASTATLNPTTAVMTIDGPVNIGLNNHAKTLRLDGASSGNLISGVVSNNLNTLNVLKSGTSTWELSGANSYTGTTIVRQGTLSLTGNRTNVAIGAITVGDTAGLDATLNISNGSHNLGTGQMNVANAPTTAITGTVNQSGGSVIFGAGGGNQLLVGQNSVANRGIYNLSGGSLTIGLSTATGRGVMLGVNAGSAGGTFNLSGTGELNMTLASGGTGNATLQVGRYDSAANNTTNYFNQTGGTANVGVLSIGGNGGTGTGIVSAVSLTGGIFRANVFARMAAGNSNTATLTIGGNADVTLPAIPVTRGTGSSATVIFDGGVLKPSAASTAYLAAPTAASIKSGGAKINTNSFDITISQNLLRDSEASTGGLIKEGSGTLALTGVNTYKGDTEVSAGALSLGNGSANTGLADTADVRIASGATLNLNFSGTDVIDGLVINGVAKSPGIWGSESSGAPNVDAQLAGSGTLTVTTGPSISAYEAWTSSFSLSGPNAAFDFDYDNDGIENGLEWILGGNPTANSADILPLATRNPAGDLILSFNRKEESIAETTLRVEFGTDLASWPKQASIGAGNSGPDTNGVIVEVNTVASPDGITVTIPASNALSGRIFARLVASKP